MKDIRQTLAVLQRVILLGHDNKSKSKITLMSTCRFCGLTAFGSCTVSPHGKHQHNTDEDHCMFCGYTAYGACDCSPHGKHEHGYGSKCRFCGLPSYGGCTVSPSGVHEH